jgi:hypothetical protein
MDNNIKGRWLKLYTSSDTCPTYLVLAESVDGVGIRGRYVTINVYTGETIPKNKSTNNWYGVFPWYWINKMEIWQ